jgi:hypothetical protein
MGNSNTFEQRSTGRYYLAGRPINGGDTVELCMSGGWVTGRFEWTADDELPSFHFSIELVRGQAPLSITLPEGARLRWPAT